MLANKIRYFFQIIYKGTHYHGWQMQKNAHTVQEIIQNCLEKLLQRALPIVGSSRTDTGVHAKQQFAHIDLEANVDTKQLLYKLNFLLPPDIAILPFIPVKTEAHARFSACARTYEYIITKTKNPFLHATSFFYPKPLALEVMNSAAMLLYIKTDFKSFSKVTAPSCSSLCTIMHAKWYETDDQLIFRITANRFLRGMVRIIVGNMLKIGSGKLSIADFEAKLDKKAHGTASFIAPAQGLSLIEVAYPEEIFL